MKQLLKIFALVVSVGIAGNAIAQGCPGGNGKGGHHGDHAQMMKETLGLSDAQATQMDAIHEKYHPQIKAVWEDESLSQEAKMNKMRDIHAAQRAEVQAILTPEQMAKADALHAQHGPGGHHAQAGSGSGGSGSGPGGSHVRGHGKHGHHGSQHRGGHAELAKQLEPIAKAQRAKLEPQLSAEDKATLAVLRQDMAELHVQMQAAHAQMRSLHEEGQLPSEAQRTTMQRLHAQKRTIMDQALGLADKYKPQIQALHDEAWPQIEAVLKKMEAQNAKHGSGHGCHGHGKCQGNPGGSGHGHQGPMGHGGAPDHDRMLAHFMLMDPSAAHGPAKTTAATPKAVAGNGAEAANSEIVIFPNPATTTHTIRYTTAQQGQVRIELMSIDGKVLRMVSDGQQAAGTHALEVNTSELSAGTYLYRIVDASGSRSQRFSVTK